MIEEGVFGGGMVKSRLKEAVLGEAAMRFRSLLVSILALHVSASGSYDDHRGGRPTTNASGRLSSMGWEECAESSSLHLPAVMMMLGRTFAKAFANVGFCGISDEEKENKVSSTTHVVQS